MDRLLDGDIGRQENWRRCFALYRGSYSAANGIDW
jgi:hypothetical protein